MKTKAKKKKMENIKRRLKFDRCQIIAVEGLIGGLSLLWKNDVICDICVNGRNYFHFYCSHVTSRKSFLMGPFILIESLFGVLNANKLSDLNIFLAFSYVNYRPLDSAEWTASHMSTLSVNFFFRLGCTNHNATLDSPIFHKINTSSYARFEPAPPVLLFFQIFYNC